jgi:hypothetical protein
MFQKETTIKHPRELSANSSSVLLSSVGDLRLRLLDEFNRRCQSNPKYSLRAFAKSLGTDVSRLSKMLRKKLPIREDFIKQFGIRIGMSISEIPPRKKN